MCSHLVHGVADLVIGGVEVRGDPDPGSRPMVDQDLAPQQLASHGLGLGHVEDHHAATLLGVLRGARGEAARACQVQQQPDLSHRLLAGSPTHRPPR